MCQKFAKLLKAQLNPMKTGGVSMVYLLVTTKTMANAWTDRLSLKIEALIITVKIMCSCKTNIATVRRSGLTLLPF